MPISGVGSYIPTINLFLPHWVDVNTALGASGLFAETDSLVLTLPKLSPDPGATPDSVTANIS